MIKRDLKILQSFLDLNILEKNLEYGEAFNIWNEQNKNNYSNTFRDRLFGFFWYIYIKNHSHD